MKMCPTNDCPIPVTVDKPSPISGMTICESIKLQLRNSGSFQKSDERIFGDGYFVESELADADEKMTHRFAYKAKRISLDHLQQSEATLIGIVPEEWVGIQIAGR